MSWIRSSKSATLVVLIALLVSAAGTAGAISVTSEGVPEESAVGDRVSATVVIEDPFVEMNDQWTLAGSTELENVSWTVTVLQQGEEIDNGGQATYGEQSFEQALNASNGGDTVEVEVTGDVPAVDNYTYQPRETYSLYDLNSIVGSSESDLNASQVHHYTDESRTTRQAIDDAAAAINESGGNSEAESLLNNAVSSYENGNFDNAQDLAGQAQSQAEQAQQSQQTTQLALYGVAALVVLLVIGGGVYYWRSNQDEPSKLQ
jgi:cellobiose-specific phosphotransferase system component IIA